MEDHTIENLIELDGLRYVIDEHLGLWVKFDVRRVYITKDRPHGIKYSLTLHNRYNERVMGFDNAHAIENTVGRNTFLQMGYDHWHRDSSNKAIPYDYKNAASLLEDFWKEVDRILKKFRGEAI